MAHGFLLRHVLLLVPNKVMWYKGERAPSVWDYLNCIILYWWSSRTLSLSLSFCLSIHLWIRVRGCAALWCQGGVQAVCAEGSGWRRAARSEAFASPCWRKQLRELGFVFSRSPSLANICCVHLMSFAVSLPLSLTLDLALSGALVSAAENLWIVWERVKISTAWFLSNVWSCAFIFLAQRYIRGDVFFFSTSPVCSCHEALNNYLLIFSMASRCVLQTWIKKQLQIKVFWSIKREAFIKKQVCIFCGSPPRTSLSSSSAHSAEATKYNIIL